LLPEVPILSNHSHVDWNSASKHGVRNMKDNTFVRYTETQK
jgi:hypothetical protein